MADTNRTTLVVAVAGIAATALVGLAGTSAAWISARDDRGAQRELAREERSYDRRVSVYLDAIDFVENQKKALAEFEVEPFEEFEIQYEFVAPPRLTTRLIAFGSAKAVEAFEKTQSIQTEVISDFVQEEGPRGRYISGTPDDDFFTKYKQMIAQSTRFQNIVHEEVG